MPARAWVVVLMAVLVGAPAVADAPPFAGETSVTLVEVPVEVERRGEPVVGLAAGDFAVTSDGRSLPVVAFETIELGDVPAGGAAATPPPAARRHLFLLFDFAFSHPQRVAHGVAEARELVAGGLHPSDLVAVGTYLPTGELTVLLSFTPDRAAADRVLATLAAAVGGEDAPTAAADADAGAGGDPLRLTGHGLPKDLLSQLHHTDTRNYPREAASEVLLTGSKGAALLIGRLNAMATKQEPHLEDARRDHVESLVDGIADLAAMLRTVDGRKILALFSERLPIDFVGSPGMRYSHFDQPMTGGSELLGRLDDVLRELRRDGWVLHPVDLTGTRTDEFGTDGLFVLADRTGGVLVEGTGDLAGGLGRALARSARGYLLTVQVDDVAFDGAFHPLEVRLAGAPRGTKLRHREGFRAPLPFAERADAARLAEAAALVAAGAERDDLGVEVMAVPLAAGADATRVAVVLEIPGETLLAAPAARLGLEVYGYALDATGTSRDFFAYAVDLDPRRVGTRLADAGVRVLGDLDLPPGAYRVRVLVRDRRDGRATLATLPVDVGRGAPRQLDALFLTASGDTWVLVPPRADAFRVHGLPVLPAAHATLPEAGEAQLLLVGSGFDAAGAALASRVLDAAGRPVDGARVELLGVTPGDDGEPDLVLGRLHAGSLPPGAYVLEVHLESAAAPGGGPRSVRPFLVLPSET